MLLSTGGIARRSSTPGWLAGKPVNEWFEIPGTNMSSVLPSNTYSGTPEARVTAWNGAGLKRAGSVYLAGAAGGHADYSGNDVVALRLSVDSPAWSMLRDTTPQNQVVNDAAVYLDYRRSATHTYWLTQFVEALNRLAIFPAPGMGDGQYASITSANAAHVSAYSGGIVASFSLDTNDWDATVMQSTGSGVIATWPGSGDFTASLCCTDHSTGNVFLAREGEGTHSLWKWTRATNAWSQLNAGNFWHINYGAGAIDHTRGKMLVVGDYGGTLAARVYNISDGSTDSVTFTGLGGDALKMSGYPGLFYDEANDRFVVVSNTNPITLLTVSPAWDVASLSTTGTAPATRTNGILNAPQYVPELRGVALCNSHSENVKFMKVAA